MIGRSLEDRLRDWYRDEVGSEQVPASLQSAVSTIPARVRPAPRLAETLASPRVRFLLVAGLLAALLATLISVGALWRAVEPPVVQLPRFVGAECMGSAAALPADRLLVFEDRNASAGFAGDGDAPPGITVILYLDGRLVTQPNGRTKAMIAAGESGSTVRRLSPRGVELMLAEIERSRLAVAGCHYDLLSEGQLRQLDVRLPGKPVASTHWGTYSGIDDPLSEEDRSALAALQARIQRPAEWLPAVAWLDVEDRTLVADRWQILVRLVPAAVAYSLAAPERTDLPRVLDINLPGGQDPRIYGTHVGEDTQGIAHRCDVVDAATASTVLQDLNRTGAPIANSGFWFADGEDRVMVSVVPLFDAGSGCTPFELGLQAPGQAPPSPAPSGQ